MLLHTRIQLSALLVTTVLLASRCAAQITEQHSNTSLAPIEGSAPKEVVDELWRLATQGELFTTTGWDRAGKLFTDPPTFKRPKVILIVSNEWGPAGEIRVGPDQAEVEVGFIPLGNIDNALRFTPAPPTNCVVKESFLYRLAAVPNYTLMYGPDGKTLLSKRPTGTRLWRIRDSQALFMFTTVNSAIRYVLEQRDKTHDPVIKQNADRTLEILRRLH